MAAFFWSSSSWVSSSVVIPSAAAAASIVRYPFSTSVIAGRRPSSIVTPISAAACSFSDQVFAKSPACLSTEPIMFPICSNVKVTS